MSGMNSENERWSIYSAAQNLPAVLNNPHLGKQSNFFVRTWGDTFVEKTETGKSPFLPEVTYDHFETYMVRYGKRLKRHKRLGQTKVTRSKSETVNSDVELSEVIPEAFLKKDFHVKDSGVFNFQKNKDNGRELLEELSHYLDIVEMHIAKHVSQKSDAFFHAMTSHDTIMENMKTTCHEVHNMRSKLQVIDKSLAKDPLYLIGLRRMSVNYNSVMHKLKLMSTVLQTQPTLQLLLSSSDYVGALELISSTQEVLANELAGVTSLRHLPSQLKEMLKLIDKMLHTEFERCTAADLHRPLDDDRTILEDGQLISLISGLLRQNNFHFLEVYKQESITAAQTLMKQYLIEVLADVEDEEEHCLRGSGEVNVAMDSMQWMKTLSAASEALEKLLQRILSVHNLIKETADSSAGLTSKSTSELNVYKSEHFLSAQDHANIKKKLQELLISVCDYCNERLAAIIGSQTDKQALSAYQIMELSITIEQFSKCCEEICGRSSPALRAAFKIQAGNYVHKFHIQRKTKLTYLLDAETWKTAEVPSEIQFLLDKLASNELIKSLPTSPIDLDNNITQNEKKAALALMVNGRKYVTVGTALILIRIVCEYCVCAYELPQLASVIGKDIAELLRIFNSRSCQLVLGAGALKIAGLKTITSTNLALTSRSLQLVSWMIPHIQAHFKELTSDPLLTFKSVERDVANHIQQLETKVLSIMSTLLGDQLNEWDAKPPLPSKHFRNISRHIIKLHEAVSSVLPTEQVSLIYEVVHKNFKAALREQLVRLNIQKNGGPQHGVVTAEITFYLQTMTGLNVLPEKVLSDMEDIWQAL